LIFDASACNLTSVLLWEELVVKYSRWLMPLLVLICPFPLLLSAQGADFIDEDAFFQPGCISSSEGAGVYARGNSQHEIRVAFGQVEGVVETKGFLFQNTPTVSFSCQILKNFGGFQTYELSLPVSIMESQVYDDVAGRYRIQVSAGQLSSLVSNEPWKLNDQDTISKCQYSLNIYDQNQAETEIILASSHGHQSSLNFLQDACMAQSISKYLLNPKEPLRLEQNTWTGELTIGL